MFRRLQVYFREMYPIIPRLFIALIYFFEVYFVLLLNENVTQFQLGISEAVGAFTLFAFLLLLRIADDFKDYETDSRLFPERPLPSGRVTHQDLATVLIAIIFLAVSLNYAFMNNFLWFIILFTYGTLMSLWFFQRNKIQNSLPLALVTHNPIMMVLNVYVITFVCIKYDLPFFSMTTVLLAFTMYFPSLIWEVSRKIRAPKDETAYVTYSKLFTYQKATRFVQVLTLLDIVTNFILVWGISRLAALVLLLNVTWMTWQFQQFIHDPTQFKLIDRVERYTIITEATMVIAVAWYLLSGQVG